ncbi:hypothetical protein EDD18DRAFT_1112477 [Armillaria luteobubalina]|uniref:Uncharacterized protein n=1 Tax=Armillaria luteobubalina TaxID=153913 RepID=A0AA39PFJ5_9AGAR|nr:hypothetical protein EDD18DRAFT_1112477 [Armillaria luteobubalina]
METEFQTCACQTGFGPHEEEYLCKNAFDTTWKDFLLHWPPEDHSKGGLWRHHEHVKNALCWLFNTLDPDFFYPCGKLENQCSTIQCAKVPQPIKIYTLPTPEEQAKDMAIHATKWVVKKWKNVGLDMLLEASTFRCDTMNFHRT